MKAYVITIESLPQSVDAAERCIKSGKKYGVDVEVHPAFTPSKKVDDYLKQYRIPTVNFAESYSRYEKCVAAFCSHHSLWVKATQENDVLILEHDAVFTGPIPTSPYKKLVNYGHPSYGRWIDPPLFGIQKLISKEYLPGAHGYRINNYGALALIERAMLNACPTDLFINNENFDFIQEHYPWCIKADDTFTTIQNRAGTLAKHNYNKGIKVI